MAVTPRVDYFEHAADIGVIGRGATLEAAFEAAAAAMFAIMADPAGAAAPGGAPIHAGVAFTEADPEFALVCWLNALLAAAREQGGFFDTFHLTRDGEHWRGEAAGRRWGPEEERGTEVKGATLTALAVRELQGCWDARCVVDV